MNRFCNLWQGATVAILAPGPTLTRELADSVRHLPRIAVRNAFRFAPDADMLIALDGPPGDGFWHDARDFAGMKVCGARCKDALYLPMPHERVTIRAGHVIEIRNSGLAAIRIAAEAGAKEILLLGFDPHLALGRYPGMVEGLAAITAELRAAGIECKRYKEAECLA